MNCTEPEDPALPDDFRSDREMGIEPFTRREKRYPELLDGMSMYGSYEAALQRWRECRRIAREKDQAMQIPPHIAEVWLVPGEDFSVEEENDPRDPEHLTVWGHPAKLAAQTRRIYTSHMREE